jgi:hypothetical protein
LDLEQASKPPPKQFLFHYRPSRKIALLLFFTPQVNCSAVIGKAQSMHGGHIFSARGHQQAHRQETQREKSHLATPFIDMPIRHINRVSITSAAIFVPFWRKQNRIVLSSIRKKKIVSGRERWRSYRELADRK